MPRQLWIDDHIEFRGDALHRSNVDGPMQPTKVHFHDHFLGHTLDTTQLYTSTAAGGGSQANAIVAAIGGQLRLLLSTSNNASQMVATALNYEDDMYAACEAKIRIDTVANTHLFFGFTDATSESTPKTPIDYDTGTINTDGATVACGFVCDADYESSSIICAGVGETLADGGTDWADGEWHTLRIELNPDAGAHFYLDGESYGYLDAGIAASGTALCMMVCASTRDTGGTHVHVDYWDAWQNQGE